MFSETPPPLLQLFSDFLLDSSLRSFLLTATYKAVGPDEKTKGHLATDALH